MRRQGAGRWLGLVGLSVLLAFSGGAGADDVPESARKKYEEARTLFAKGDDKSLAAALTALSEAKVRAPDSADFWELFVRVWRGAKKPEADLQKVITAREQAAPKSAVFDIVRARLETDPAKKGEHLQKAAEKDPGSVTVRMLLVAHHRAQGEEMKAEELLEKVLADQPGNEEALVAKTEMMVESGLSSSAVAFAREELAKKDCPALRYALALALRRQAQEDPSKKPEALAEARKAVEARPDPLYVATLADLLDESDRTAEAVALLKTHTAKVNDPRLASRLGAFAFRAGDYDTATKSLAVSAAGDIKAAKALALAHARRNRPKEARAALDQVVAADKEAATFAAAVELVLGDPAAIRRRLLGRTDDVAKSLLLKADALDGKAAEVAAAAGKDAASGSREGEDLLLLLVQARLHAKLAARSPIVRRMFVDARSEAAKSVMPEAKRLSQPVEYVAKSHGLMTRIVSYCRSVCGGRLSGAEISFSFILDPSGPRASVAAVGRDECAREPARTIAFRASETAENTGTLEISDHADVWEAASKAFTEGCAALAAENATKAADQFSLALDKEPGWHRAKLFRALAQAFQPGSDLPSVARAALEAVSEVPDDWEGREVAITLAVWAGVDASDQLRNLGRHIEERSPRRFDQL